MCVLVTLRDRGERGRSSNHKSSSSGLRHSRVWLYPWVFGPVNRQDKRSDPACPGPCRHGVRFDRGSCGAAEISCRRRRGVTGRRWCRRCRRRVVLVTATSASTGAIMSAAAASARCSTAGRRSGVGAGDQVKVTDFRHPALRMAPAAQQTSMIQGGRGWFLRLFHPDLGAWARVDHGRRAVSWRSEAPGR
jgi:hypothetical protein